MLMNNNGFYECNTEKEENKYIKCIKCKIKS